MLSLILLAATVQAQEICAGCHKSIAASWAKTPMAQTFSPVGDVPAGSFEHAASQQSFEVADGRMRRAENGYAVDKRIDYAIGSGTHARSYLSRTAAGELIELPLTWYTENGGYWAMSPGYDHAQHAGFSRKVTYRCMFCHNVYPSLAAGTDRADNATHWPAQLPTGINCERCHGPGDRHARNPAPGTIVNPAKLSPVRRDEVCLQCHLETANLPLPAFVKRPERGVFSYRPGEPLEDYGLHFDHAPGTGFDGKLEFGGAPYRLRQSLCFTQSGGSLTCTTCHKPHGGTTVVDYDRACQTCHRSLKADHATANCTTCHMPKARPDDALRVTITDHLIARVPAPRPTPAEERHGANTPPYRGQPVLYYPPAASQNARLQVAHEKHPNETAKERAAALTAQGRHAEAVSVLRAAVTRDPDAGDLHSNLGLALLRQGDSVAAAKALREAVRLRPEVAAIRVNLGTLLARQGDRLGARYEFEHALRLARAGGAAALVARVEKALAAIR